MATRRVPKPLLGADAWLARRQFAHIASPVQPPPFKDPEAVGKAAERVFRSLGLPLEDALAARIERLWPSIVGPDVARNARPGPVERGTLVVFARGSAWYAELRREARTGLLARLREALCAGGGACPVSSVTVKIDTEGARW